MDSHHDQGEEILLPKCYTPLPPQTKPAPTTAPLINVGLVKTHGKCLPFDLEFAPYQVDNVVFHFPLPPVLKTPRQELSPIDSAVSIPDLVAEWSKLPPPQTEISTPAEGAEDERYQKRLRRETRVDLLCRNIPARDSSLHWSKVAPSSYEVPKLAQDEQNNKVEKQSRRKTRIEIPKREIPLHPLLPQSSQILPPSYEDSVAQDAHRVDLERQQALNKLEEKAIDKTSVKETFISDTKRQLADMSTTQKPLPTRIGLAPPSRPASRETIRREEINPDFQSSSESLRRRAASIRRQRQEEEPPPLPPKSRSRSHSSTNKAQILLGLQAPKSPQSNNSSIKPSSNSNNSLLRSRKRFLIVGILDVGLIVVRKERFWMNRLSICRVAPGELMREFIRGVVTGVGR